MNFQDDLECTLPISLLGHFSQTLWHSCLANQSNTLIHVSPLVFTRIFFVILWDINRIMKYWNHSVPLEMNYFGKLEIWHYKWHYMYQLIQTCQFFFFCLFGISDNARIGKEFWIPLGDNTNNYIKHHIGSTMKQNRTKDMLMMLIPTQLPLDLKLHI